jgi:hydroxymethylpyrimidine pyrophosphatase-like HAD family hydrolase/energy-coupling factor transporter ATP-binding protein EcfA2
VANRGIVNVVRYLALATDYDGTLAADGVVSEQTIQALERFRESGRKLIMVTGRELVDLEQVFDRMDLFDRIVAENGAVLYRPDTKDRQVLCDPPPAEFAKELQSRGAEPLSVGDVIVATRQPHETDAIEVIASLGLELQVIFNKGAVMVLPPGVNKAFGLKAALDELGLSARNVAGVGDAENDHAFLDECELSVAVANALPAVQDRCDHVTSSPRGEGVVELIDAILSEDAAAWRPERKRIIVGPSDEDGDVSIEPFGEALLAAGPSGSGKSTTVVSLLELLQEAGYQLLVVDPEGDYGGFPGTVQMGDPKHPPVIEEITQLVADGSSLSINMLAMPLEDRPAFFEQILSALAELLQRTGRPHWLIIDEAHHLLPSNWQKTVPALREFAGSLMFVTVHPDMVAPPVIELITGVFAVGDSPSKTIKPVADARGLETPDIEHRQDRVVFWRPDGAAVHVAPIPSEYQHQRHIRKYAEGDLKDRAFYFTGPNDELKLRAQNLQIFKQIAEGIDEATWMFHLQRGDFETWFAECVKDPELAEVARDAASQASTSRETICQAIEERYTAPASPSKETEAART